MYVLDKDMYFQKLVYFSLPPSYVYMTMSQTICPVAGQVTGQESIV